MVCLRLNRWLLEKVLPVDFESRPKSNWSLTLILLGGQTFRLGIDELTWMSFIFLFMVIEQAMGVQAGRGAAAEQLLREFVEQAKASGFVAEALARHKIQGAIVAPKV